MKNNYRPFMIIGDVEHMAEPMSCAEAYDEATRFKSEYSPSECGVKIFRKDIMVIKSWKDGVHHRLNGAYMYKFNI